MSWGGRGPRLALKKFDEEDSGIEFIKALEEVINRHSQENASNTPDYILAQFLESVLAAWNTATQQRETWYGRDARHSSVVGVNTDPVSPTEQ